MNLCDVCGNPIEKESKFKPIKYCSNTCGDFQNLKDAMERKLLMIRPTSKARKLLRGDMFRLSNSISISSVTQKDKQC